MYRLPGDHRRPDLPSVHATGLSAEGKGHPETRWLPVALLGTPTASCPSGRALLVGTLASRPGRPITEQRAARDTTSSQHPVDSRLRCSGRREVCAVGNESPHSEMARRLGRACLPARRQPREPPPRQPSDLAVPEGPGAHAVLQGRCQPPPCRRSPEAEGTCQPGACGRAGPGPFPRPAPWPKACGSSTRCPAGAWLPGAVGPSATRSQSPAPRAVERQAEPPCRAGPPQLSLRPSPSQTPHGCSSRGSSAAPSPTVCLGCTPPLPGDGLGAAARIQPQTWPRVHTPAQPSPAPQAPLPTGMWGGGDRGPPGVTQGSTSRGASQRPGGEGRTPQAPAQVGQGAPTPTPQAPDTQPGVWGRWSPCVCVRSECLCWDTAACWYPRCPEGEGTARSHQDPQQGRGAHRRGVTGPGVPAGAGLAGASARSPGAAHEEAASCCPQAGFL